MSLKRFLKSSAAVIGIVAMLANNTVAMAQSSPPSSLTTAQKVALLRTKVKYVFVIFAENRSFDHYFGTFPGANGLFSAPAGATPANQTVSFVQKYLDTNLQTQTISPFLIPQAVTVVPGAPNAGQVVPIYPADIVSVNHAHQGMVNDMDYQGTGIGGVSLNDRYAMTQEGLTTSASGALVKGNGAAPTAITLAQQQTAEMDLGHIDCDTIPFLWHWANTFAMFDNFAQSIIGPSTPNAIAIIAGQSGQTQWALHPNQGVVTTYANPAFPVAEGASYGSNFTGNSAAYVPIVADPGPFPGSNLDKSAVKPPYNADENANNPALNLTFATQPLSFMGGNIGAIIANDQNPRADLLDVQHDIAAIGILDPTVSWGWYQQGFNGNDAPDPFEFTYGTGTPNPTGDKGLYSGYILHHNGPQYFGYLADNPEVLNGNLHGAKDFFTDLSSGNIAQTGGGVFYLRGGYDNNDGLVPVDPTPGIQHAYLGNDDHPAYSDSQISEALAAEAINAIVAAGLWEQSAIVITYDETDGYYDHVSPTVRATFGDGSPLGGGPRIPAILISPWAKAGTISHQYSEHGSFLKFVNELFGLVPLASLPDEKHARALGAKAPLNQPNLEPTDDPANELGDMTEAFDYTALANGTPLPSSLATFTPAQIATLPHLAGTSSPNGVTNGACQAIGMLPTDYTSLAAYQAGQPTDPAPVDVNPRPSQSPGTPSSGTWTP